MPTPVKNKSPQIDKQNAEQYNSIPDIFSEEDNASSASDAPASAPSPEDKVSAKQPKEHGIKGSKSWKKDDYNENTWSRANLLKAELSDKSFTLRWVRDGSHSKVERALDDGFSYVFYKDLANLNKASLRDGVAIDSVVRKRDLILMKIPNHRAAARARWIESRAIDAKKAQAQFKASAGEGVGILNAEESKSLSIVKTDNAQMPDGLSQFV